MNAIVRKEENIVIIDSNFILLPFQFKIDYLTDIKLNLEGITSFIVYQQVLNELEAKKKRESKAIKFQKQFESGLLYLENNKKNYNIIFDNKTKYNSETTDEFLLRQSVDLKSKFKHVYLATNDSDLRKKAKELEISLIFLRQKKYLSFESS